jgi:hypothetical protein
MRRAFFAILLAVVAAAALSGCVRAHATVTPESPALQVPQPPPREVEPNDTEPPPPMPLPQEPARAATPRARPAPPQVRPEPERPSEPPQESMPPAVEPPKPVEEPPRTPPMTLQTTPPKAEGEVERSVQATLTKAQNDLNHIDYRALSVDARLQYDTAKSWIAQAERAIRAKNLVFAKSLADKAAALAVQLGGK